MNLESFGYAIGISDILDYRECPERMAVNMQRHLGAEEKIDWTNAYGSAIHMAIEWLTVWEDQTVEQREDAGGPIHTEAAYSEAIGKSWERYGDYLDPEHLKMLTEDLQSWHKRDPRGFELIKAEQDLKIPLFVFEGKQIYYRFKIDALYRSRENRSIWLMRDYKSSQHRKTDNEVHADRQMTAYNLGIHEYYPECKHLIQLYEQLRFGTVTTSRTQADREIFKQWLIRNVTKILHDEDIQPKINGYCKWCPMVMECPAVRNAPRYWRGTMAVLAPKTKEGRKVTVEFPDENDEVEELIKSVLPTAIQARGHIALFEGRLKDLLREMPSDKRRELGWRLSESKGKKITPEGLRRIHEVAGDLFYELIALSTAEVKRLFPGSYNGLAARVRNEVEAQQLETVTLSTVKPERNS
jgi:hypothetical protein